MKKPNIYSLVSSFLLIFPICLSLYIFYPVLLSEWNYYKLDKKYNLEQTPKSSEFGIIIPKLGINESIIENINPFDSNEYLPALTQGVAHAKGTKTPNITGLTYLFAHSSDNLLALTRYNTTFYLLPKLEPGDVIQIYYQNQKHNYAVFEKKIVKPSQVEFLTQNNEDQLILQTCTPAGTSINRLLVFAKRIPA